MKITEFKETIAKAQKEDVLKIAVECYKAVAKDQKDELDDKIFAMVNGQEPQINVKKLLEDVKVFISEANEGYYFRPNRVVSKEARSKWRFTVSKYIKALLSVPVDSPDAGAVADTLYRLYSLLCKACVYAIFRTQDAFPAIGWGQQTLFKEIAKFGLSLNREDELRKIISLSINEGCSRMNLPENQHLVLLSENLIQKQMYDKALQIIYSLQKEFKAKSSSYSEQRKYEITCSFIYSINILRGNIIEGYDRFQKEMTHRPEDNLYYALINGFVNNSPEIWLQIYKHAVSSGVKPSQKIVEQYKEFKSSLSK